MENTIKITRKQARPILEASFPHYNGRTIRVVYTAQVCLYNTYADGGSYNDYVPLKTDGTRGRIPSFAPWDSPIEGKRFDLGRNDILVEHCHFCGHDLGVTIYAHPAQAGNLLPAGR